MRLMSAGLLLAVMGCATPATTLGPSAAKVSTTRITAGPATTDFTWVCSHTTCKFRGTVADTVTVNGVWWFYGDARADFGRGLSVSHKYFQQPFDSVRMIVFDSTKNCFGNGDCQFEVRHWVTLP